MTFRKKYSGTTIVVLLLVCCLYNNLGAQYDNGLETYLPPTPTAASFAQYAEVSVNHYTGAASQVIPLYEVKDNRLSHTISLRYHGSGIKASEIASLIGLGWNLNVGGTITRSIRGAPDEKLFEGQQSGFLVDPINPIWFQNGLDRDRILDGTYDIESDIYFYNFGDYAGSFSFNTNLEIVQRDQTDLKIEPVSTNYSFNKVLWKITTPDGTKYYFGDDSATDGISDDAVSFANHYVQPKNMPGTPGRTNPLVDSWYLVKIESYDGTSVIVFEYDEYEAYSYRNLGTSALVHIADDGMNIVNTTGGNFDQLNPVLATEALTPRITAVVTDDRRVEFEYESTFRKDLDSHVTTGLHPRYVVGIPSSKVMQQRVIKW
jgi:hypothetical protein